MLLSDYFSLETKKLHAAAQIAQEGASKEIEEYLSKFNFPSETSLKNSQKLHYSTILWSCNFNALQIIFMKNVKT